MEQPMEFVPMPGAVIEASDGYLGRVEQVLANPDNQEPNYLVTQPNPTGERLTIPLDLVGEDSRPDMVYLKVTGAEARRQAGVISETEWQGNGRMVLPVVEERLEVSKRPVEVGELLVHKSVEEYEDTANLDLTRDNVEIERVAVNRPLEEPAQTRQEGDWLIIPVMQEVLVVQKQLMLTEEIRIRKRQITEPKEVRETLRREHVELENKKNL